MVAQGWNAFAPTVWRTAHAMKNIALTFDEPEPIDAGPALVAHRLAGRSTRLVVSLAGVGMRRGSTPPLEFIGTASDGGKNHVLFISDARRSWLNGPGVTEGIIDLVERYRKTHGITETILLGNSMGGFAALVLADLIAVDTVIAFAPQFSVHPDIVPEETRWSFHISRIKNWVYDDVGALDRPNTAYFLFHDEHPWEARHWLRFPWHARLNHFILSGLAHEVASRLQKRRMLAQVVHHAIEQRPRVLRHKLERSVFGRRFNVLRREDYHRKYPDMCLQRLQESDREEDRK